MLKKNVRNGQHKSLTCISTYQTLSPTRRTFVFLVSRYTRPLAPRNAHAIRCEFLKWQTGQRGKQRKQSDFAMNIQRTPPLERRIHGRKIQNCMRLRSGRLKKINKRLKIHYVGYSTCFDSVRSFRYK